MTMPAPSLAQRFEQTKIEGQLASGSDRIVPLPLWIDWAKRCYPFKTAMHLAGIAGCEERTAKRWLSGEFEPHPLVMKALQDKLWESFSRR